MVEYILLNYFEFEPGFRRRFPLKTCLSRALAAPLFNGAEQLLLFW